MDDFDRLVVEESIKAKLGPITRIDLCHREQVTPMTMFIGVAEESAQHPIDLFWVDDGVPAHFTLANEHTAPVVFHSRHLELSGQIRAICTTDSLASVREDLAWRVCLRMIAEFLLAQDAVDQSLQCLAKSRLGSGMYIQEPDLMYLERMPIDERYLCTWFFGLGHEIGHCIRADVRDVLASLQPLSLGELRPLIDSLVGARDQGEADTLRAILRKNESAGQSSCYASAERLQEEAVCDLFSALSIVRAAQRILPKVGRDLDVTRLFPELMMAFNAIALIEQCRILADWFRDMENELENQNLAFINIAINARANSLRRVFQDESFYSLLASTFGDTSDCLSRMYHCALSEAHENVAFQSTEMHNGLHKARRFLSSAEMRDPELFYSYVKEIGGNPFAGLEAARFVRNAQLLKRRTPELDLLALAAGRWTKGNQGTDRLPGNEHLRVCDVTAQS